MSDSHKITFAQRHTRMVACDSDGCVFDVMDLKHKECFCPAFIKHFQLQRCARATREVWEFVNLYSRTRGCNRFKAVVLALDFLSTHPDVLALGMHTRLMDATALRDFVATSKALDEPALERAAAETRDPALRATLAWTREVNASVAAMCTGLGPFDGASEVLAAIAARSDLVVVSQAPRATLLAEWAHAGLDKSTAFIAGQEFGAKAGQIRQAMAVGHCASDCVLVLGDAPGDLEAAQEVGAKFFPITPKNESACWRRLASEALPRFLSGNFDAEYQAELNASFSAALPENPPWR